MKSKVSTPAANYSATAYAKPTSHIDPITGELVIRVAPSTIAALTKRWWSENSGEHDFIRIIDEAGLADAVRANVHGYDEDWFPGDMSAVESWIGGSGCQAVLEDDALFEVIPMAEVEFPRQVFFGEWRGSYRTNLVDDFNIHRTELTGIEFLYASCTDAQDEGRIATIIFRLGGKIFEVSACHGADREDFDGQWKPVKTSVMQLRDKFISPDKGFEAEWQLIMTALDEIEAEVSKPDTTPAASSIPVEQPLPMDTAPKDHTIVRLLVDFSEPGDERKGSWVPLTDDDQSWTIGFNGFDDTEIDEWQFVGWSWSQDCFLDCQSPAHGKVIGWLPFSQTHSIRRK